MVYDSFRREMVVFGGVHWNGQRGAETWLYRGGVTAKFRSFGLGCGPSPTVALSGTRLVDARVSRKHIQLKRDDDGAHTLVHVSRSNSTYLNGDPVTDPTVLGDGDEIRAGNSTMVYTTSDDVDAQSAQDAWFKKGQRFKTSISDDDPEDLNQT